MRIPLSEVGRQGRLELAFVPQRGRTVLRKAYCEVPFKITRVLNPPQPTAHLILMQCTAGLFGGDSVECSLRVESGARVRITQQSATKIHPSRARQATQRNRVFVESGAELHLYLEPIIPFADSRLRQETVLDVQPGGTLHFWESFMTGRIGRGESWQFHELASETRLQSEGNLIYLDRFHLLPDSLQPSLWTMGRNNYAGTGLYVGEGARDFVSRLHEALPESGVDALSDHLVVVRVVSASGPEFHRCREMFVRLADQESHS
jgi:urease accessory protein